MELTNTRLFLALLFAGSMVAPVFLQVAFFAPLIDLGSENRTILNQSIKLILQTVIGLLRQPGCLGFRHSRSSISNKYASTALREAAH